MTYRAPPSPGILVVGYAGRVIALDPTTGRRFWQYNADKPRQSMETRILVHGDRVYALLDIELHVLEHVTGRVLRRTPVPYNTGRTFVFLENRIFAAGNGAIACFDLDGNLAWADPFDATIGATVSLAVPGFSVQGDLA